MVANMPERIQVRGVRSNAVDYIEVPTMAEAYLSALEAEKAAYAARGDAQGVADVEAEITRLSKNIEPVVCDGSNCRLMHPHAGPPVLRTQRM